jgi:CRISPR-associated endoribonuclease Cas6
MRLNLRLSTNTVPVPFDHLHQLTGALHKWLGENDIHDGLSLYSFGWLKKGEARGSGLSFPRGAVWRLTFADAVMAAQAQSGMLRDPSVAFGMAVEDVTPQRVPDFTGPFRFRVDGPVLVRSKREDGSRAHLLYDDPEAGPELTRALRRKLDAAGVDADGVTVAFDPEDGKARTKLARIKGTSYRGSLCPVVVSGPPEAVRLAWCVGVGDLTGSGFGALR